MPTLTTAPPGRIQPPLISPGTPAQEITTSAERQSASSDGVCRCATLTVASAASSACASGAPTIRERPMTTTWLDARSTPPCASSCSTDSGVTGTRTPVSTPALTPPVSCRPARSWP
eukprot:scaffold82672_cov75-Phaeocystis_antarctica.AAC.5